MFVKKARVLRFLLIVCVFTRKMQEITTQSAIGGAPMSAIQELAPFIGAYHGKIRNAKDHSGMTLEELSEKYDFSLGGNIRIYTYLDP